VRQEINTAFATKTLSCSVFALSDQSYSGWQGLIMGWGSLGGPDKSNVLQSANVPIVSNRACKNAWAANNVDIKDSMICAGDGSAAQCAVYPLALHSLQSAST
jgi:Trypsin